jgi:hypothetical protein
MVHFVGRVLAGILARFHRVPACLQLNSCEVAACLKVTSVSTASPAIPIRTGILPHASLLSTGRRLRIAIDVPTIDHVTLITTP